MTAATPARPYRGRFAPSPTGPLHFGSLVAAVGSYLDALAHAGEWLVRMEDVDTPRNVPGADADIVRTLEAFGFEWEGEVLYQSKRGEAYAAALDQLTAAGLAYGCACSRKEIADSATRPAIDGGLAYPGTCRHGLPAGRSARAWRLRVDDQSLAFEDRLQGTVSQCLESDVGDFVLRRADGLWAYQLAVTVDDEFQQISDVVRGADLLASTPRQIHLQRCLGYRTPRYAHLPVAANAAGEKLSKQTLARALDGSRAAAELVSALRFLGQQVPQTLVAARVADVWDWARAHWDFAAIPRRRAIILPV
ncbi:tRNA glutamyl-Q(34) synthetase GluQRS [Dechloromonas sp.]|uniref:tRNA glutamyl-Q(34) synthetase GluQRS n=1 Tax=Dechloromonas sp. TaxID=1917218 RepID=UPI00120E790F|nr:tRNA glutamyl-Q(34) synthetase GluQRS [Dechloromonas sp.]MBU3695755.1 tRNA glutamyl-Q(34) synthetase GluQRS [Dechloromonas sp.]TEX46270.1 MAG: tRNA glutamyl-Q(34) synthetase GluQRS [Rhodocyclaceae bacterium]